MTRYNDLTMEKRKDLREKLELVVLNRKKQIEIFDTALLKPLRKHIDLARKVRANEITIEQYLKHTSNWNEYIITLLGGTK